MVCDHSLSDVEVEYHQISEPSHCVYEAFAFSGLPCDKVRRVFRKMMDMLDIRYLTLYEETETKQRTLQNKWQVSMQHLENAGVLITALLLNRIMGHSAMPSIAIMLND